MRRAYVPLALERVPFAIITHLPNVQAEIAGFTIGDIRVSRLSWMECRLIEQSRFMNDLQDAYAYGRDPFFLVFAGYPGTVDEEAARIEARAVDAIARLTRALRLLKGGEVWNPFEFVVYRRRDGINSRDPGLFGRLPFEPNPHDLIRLSLEDIDQLDGLYAALMLFDQWRFDLEIDRTQALLGASFSPAHASYVHRLLPLIPAVEMLAGDAWPELAQARWADDRLMDWTSRFRTLRNTLAHGRQEDWKVLRDLMETTRTVIRALIREAIAARLIDPDATEVTGAALVERTLAFEAGGPARLAGLQADYPSMTG